MRPLDIIARKREGQELTAAELQCLVEGYVKGTVPDYQMSAWLMAVCIRGMAFAETAALTRIMLESGVKVSFGGLPGPFVDKHSTGGVGDKVSLILAPLAAACGLKVPMMSGRSLGHTGGTLDKLDSIPGYRTRLEVPDFVRILGTCGFAMTGQTADIAPADRLMYSLRDASATVESIPLITASILSKKCAEGAEALVFDVKFGSGAFMKTFDAARALADSLVRTAAVMGLPARALLTRMDFPLGIAVGNFLEIEESWRCLQSGGDGLWSARMTAGQLVVDGPSAALMELVLVQCAHMLVLGGLSPRLDQALELALSRLADGSARQRFLDNVRCQGGDADLMLADLGRRRAPESALVLAAADGWLESWDAMAFGRAGLELGVGRNRTDDVVLHDTGMVLDVVRGQAVKKGQGLCRVFAADRPALERALALLEPAVHISRQPVVLPQIIEEVLSI